MRSVDSSIGTGHHTKSVRQFQRKKLRRKKGSYMSQPFSCFSSFTIFIFLHTFILLYSIYYQDIPYLYCLRLNPTLGSQSLVNNTRGFFIICVI